MGFKTPELKELQDQHWEDMKSRLKPLEGGGSYDILKINSQVNAGMFHLLHENLRFLALQLFPDTAEGEFLDAHWSWRSLSRKGETHALGNIELTGAPGVSLPAGTSWDKGEQIYICEEGVTLNEEGQGQVRVRSLHPGIQGNLGQGEKLLISQLTPGLEEEALSLGILGGTERESDGDFKSRMLDSFRGGTRYGKAGDWAAWALGSSSEVVKAWEFPLSDMEGTLLIQVLGKGNQPVGNLQKVKNYIKNLAPPALWTVETPQLKGFDVSLAMLNPQEDTAENRRTVEEALASWLAREAKPGMAIPPGLLSAVASACPGITFVKAKLPEDLLFTIREFPVLGDVQWEG